MSIPQEAIPYYLQSTKKMTSAFFGFSIFNTIVLFCFTSLFLVEIKFQTDLGIFAFLSLICAFSMGIFFLFFGSWGLIRLNKVPGSTKKTQILFGVGFCLNLLSVVGFFLLYYFWMNHIFEPIGEAAAKAMGAFIHN